MAPENFSTEYEAAMAILEQREQANIIDLDALLTQAREKLHIGNSTPDQVVDAAVDAEDPSTVNQLLALADQYKREENAAKESRAKITETLRDLVGEKTELRVNGATVFTNKGTISWVLNQPYIKSMFPDIPENRTESNPIWVKQESRRALYK